MNQRLFLRSARVLAAGCLAVSLGGELLPGAGGLLHAQTAGVAARRRASTQPLNGPNVTNESDMAAGAMLDSLFSPIAPVDPLPQATTRALGVQPSKASQRSQWAATLARNPKKGDGNPPYALIDRYGGIQRYVEPSPTVDLEPHIGKTVAVRRDTGGTLLATQLELPRTARRSTLDSDVRLAAMEEPLPPIEPTPAAAGEPTEAGATPIPEEVIEGQGEFIEGEGPMLDHNGEPMMMHEGHGEVDPLYLGESPEFDACTTCGSSVCGMAGGCGIGSRPIWYVRGEYLLWWFDGMNTPPLVVQSENADFSDAQLIYGDEEILDGSRDGARVILGYWADDYGKWGVEGDYFGFSRISSTFTAGDPGHPINSQNPPPYIGRPFFNVFPFDNDGDGGTPDLPRGLALEEVETDGISGTVAVTAESLFRSAGVRIRHNLCCVPGCSTDCGDPVGCGSMVGGCASCVSGSNQSQLCTLLGKGTRRTDVMFGARWSELDERLGIEENLLDIDGADADSTFRVNDDFATNNQFVGGELGFLWEWMHRRWSVELLSKLAIGNTRQKVSIRGTTLFDGEDLETGGLLAQRSNIGDHERDQFSMIPEVGLTLGYMVTERLRFTTGYTLLYWSNVVRPGDQIDFDVNGTLLPRFAGTRIEQDPISADNPRFDFRQADLWAQGFNFGLDYRY